MFDNLIPKGWSRVTLAEVIDRHNERCAAPDREGYEFFLGVDDLDSEDTHIRRYGQIGKDELPPTFRYVFRRGMVLFPTRRPALRKCAVADRDGITGEKVLVLKPKDDDVLLPAFLPFLLASSPVKDWATKRAIGSVTPHFRWSDLGEFSFLLPPPAVQRSAVAALQAADGCVEAFRFAMSQITSVRRSFLEEMIVRSLAPRIPLRAALRTALSGGTPSRARSEYWGGDRPWLSPKDMKSRVILDTTEHVTERAVVDGAALAPAESVFVVVRGMILAHTFPVCMTTRQVSFNQDIKALVFSDEFLPRYAHVWLESMARKCLGMVSETSHGTKRLETDLLLTLEIPRESHEDQAAICDHLDAIESASAAVRARIAAAEQILAALTRKVIRPS